MSTTYETLLQEFVPRPISSQRGYQRTLKQLDGLIRKAKHSRAEDDLLELLATLVEQSEIRQGHTTPELSPRDRLAGLIEARQLTQTELSRASQVPAGRSTKFSPAAAAVHNLLACLSQAAFAAKFFASSSSVVLGRCANCCSTTGNSSDGQCVRTIP